MSSGKKVWFITGVSRGLEKSIAIEALKRGDVVVGTTHDGVFAIEVQAGQKFYALRMDESDVSQVYTAIEDAYAIQWRIDVVVDNGRLDGTVIKAALPIMRDQRAGHVINISSATGTDSERLASELKPFNIRVTSIEPAAQTPVASVIVNAVHEQPPLHLVPEPDGCDRLKQTIGA